MVLNIEKPLLAGIHPFRRVLVSFQRNHLLFLTAPRNGVFCAGLDAFGIPAAEIAHIDDLIEDVQGADRAVLLTRLAEIAASGGHIDLPLLSYGEGLLRTFHTIPFFTLKTYNRTIHTRFIKIQYLDSGQMVVDPPGVVEGTGRLTAVAPGAFAEFDFNH